MNPNLPVGGSALDFEAGARGALPEGLTQLGASMRFGLYASHFDGTERVDDETSLRSLFTSLSTRHHFGSGWAVEASLPVGSMTLDAPGTAQQRVSGFGDLELGLRYDLGALWGVGGYNPSLSLRAGLGLPTGRQTELFFDPSSSGKTDESEVAYFPTTLILLGRAAYSGSLRADLTQFATKRVALRGWLSGAASFTPTDDGVRSAPELGYGAGVMVLPAERLALGLSVAGSRKGSSKELEGDSQTTVIANSGGHWVGLELNGNVQATETLSFVGFARLPVFTDVTGRQTSETFSVGMGAFVSFGGKAKDEHEGHDHGHADHGEEGSSGVASEVPETPWVPPAATSSSGDVRDLATGGESFSLATAIEPGKLTVIDFWADWCAPCFEIGRMLEALASSDELLAVRKVEVPDFDSPVVREHLATVNALPVVWIISPEGDVIRLVGVPPRTVLSEIQAALARLRASK
ncbi:MAG: transporter [Deltaproteobacteria bacterium]|nr:transporter [Deltaproteobacteria bacterium]